MAFTAGTKVLRDDYNTVRNSMLNILGAGSGDVGYGQTLFNSSAVASGTKIRAADWDNLRLDIQRIADHQGTAVTLTDVGTTTKVSASVGVQYANSLTTLLTNRFNLAVGQFSDEALTSSTRTAGWNTTISHYFYVDFGSYDNARYYFNAGGQIRITPTFIKSTSNSINNDWENLINAVGTVYLDYTQTVGGGNTSSIGFYDLTTGAQQIYTRTGGAINSLYASNDYTIRAYRNAGSSIIYFECEFKDDKFTVDPTWGTDESVTGTIANTVVRRRPSAAVPINGVNAPTPTATNTTLL